MKNRRSLLFSMVLLIVVSTAAWSQSNTVLDKTLAAKTVGFADAAYLVMSAANKIPDSATPAEAATLVEKQGWGIRPTSGTGPVTLGTYCFMIMKAFQMHGGIMYSIFPGPRYAARELAYLGLIPGDTSPYRLFSGIEAVNIIRNVLNYKEAK